MFWFFFKLNYIIVRFISIPQFFDYKKREEIIKTNLLKNYGIQINKFKNIEFNSLPVPNLVIESLLSNLNSEKALIKTERLIIYPNGVYLFNLHVDKYINWFCCWSCSCG